MGIDRYFKKIQIQKSRHQVHGADPLRRGLPSLVPDRLGLQPVRGPLLRAGDPPRPLPGGAGGRGRGGPVVAAGGKSLQVRDFELRKIMFEFEFIHGPTSGSQQFFHELCSTDKVALFSFHFPGVLALQDTAVLA